MDATGSLTLCHGPDATSGHDERPVDNSCSTIPTTISSDRTLRRTISYASIDTIRPSSRPGVRQRITEIAENLKRKTARSKYSSRQAAPDKSVHTLAQDNKPKSSGRKATAPLRVSSQKSGEQGTVVTTDRILSLVPLKVDTDEITLSRRDPDFLIDEPPPYDVDVGWPDRVTIEIFKPVPQVDVQQEKILWSWQAPRIDVQDVRLDIRPSESDVTIWDGLQAPYHLFKCRLFLRCTTHPYDTVCLPDVDRIEMDCFTCPVGSRYARPSVLQSAYDGASPDAIDAFSGLPNAVLAAGIHVDKFWRTVLDGDGSWGWCKDVFVPLSPRLFDKVEYREFKLTGRAWIGDGCVEGELKFGISMLLREVDMKWP